LEDLVPDATTLTLVGNHLSPFVRKALAVARLKGLALEIDPLVPFYGDDRFSALNPLRHIPLLIHGDVTLPDSTVIAEYFEDLQPRPSILPGNAADRARSRWLDEYADTRMAQVLVWGVFAKSVVLPGIFKAPRDLDAIARHMSDDVPEVMDVLERHAPAEGFIAGNEIGLGDISVASQFTNLRWARQTVDAARWPRAMAWVARTEAHDALAPLNALGNTLSRLPPAQYRDALAAAGVALSPMSFATDTPRRSAISQL
jgi:glutathione S-transferase